MQTLLVHDTLHQIYESHPATPHIQTDFVVLDENGRIYYRMFFGATIFRNVTGSNDGRFSHALTS
ncbi:MAG: hypothetical protein D6706_06645 [Chloroflexi bacterium]|nr:MAG: hypothetical protein D6706_06645 [Chloroflexota bacterium]